MLGIYSFLRLSPCVKACHKIILLSHRLCHALFRLVKRSHQLNYFPENLNINERHNYTWTKIAENFFSLSIYWGSIQSNSGLVLTRPAMTKSKTVVVSCTKKKHPLSEENFDHTYTRHCCSFAKFSYLYP